jgi:hypothetical protein
MYATCTGLAPASPIFLRSVTVTSYTCILPILVAGFPLSNADLPRGFEFRMCVS